QAIIVGARRDIRHGLQARRQNVRGHLGRMPAYEFLAVVKKRFGPHTNTWARRRVRDGSSVKPDADSGDVRGGGPVRLIVQVEDEMCAPETITHTPPITDKSLKSR